MYSASLSPGNVVDLCWGVAAADFSSSVDGNNNNIEKGSPFINLIKPKTGDRLTFEFNHALAQLNVQVDADIDVESHNASSLAAQTHIYVRSVTFTGFTLRGSLNLNSNTTNGPAWFDLSGTDHLKRDPVTVHDGRTDGLEAIAEDVNEVPSGLHPGIIQTGASEGVTNTAVNLFNSTELDAPVLVIPTSGVPVKVTIVYDIETADPSLPGYLSDGVTHGISVENKITKNITTDLGNMIFSAGKKYVVKLHLGLTSVKFDADVAAWDNTTYEGTAYLPENATSLGTVTITSGTESLSSLTMWKGESMATAPTVTVTDENDNPVTGFDMEWTSSNTDVATVDENGTVTPVAPGTATITVKTKKDGRTASKSYPLYINELTGINITSTATDITIGGTLPVKATLEINGGNAVNGDITNNLPSVAWESSATDKISVITPINAVKEGDAYVATTTATAAGTAVIGDQSVITASLGELSNSVTLTCTDTRTVTEVTLGTSTTTVWRYEGFTVPSVTVMGSDESDLTTLATITWELNGNPVTVIDGVIPLATAGEATITVTASYNNSEASDNVTVYANEVTGISVAPASANVLKDATTTLTASLAKTEYGDVTALTDPEISWSSGSTGYVTVSPATGTSTTASGVSAGSSTVTASIPSDYMQSDVANSASCTVQCVTKSMMVFRGYEVSPGILYRDNQGNYGLTNIRDGENFNPFELRGYWNTTSLNSSTTSSTYYFQFTFLRGEDELGADGNNINTESEKLPDGWTVPSSSIWGTILFGEPKSPITVNNKQLHGNNSNSGAYAFVRIQSAENSEVYYPGILLFRDGMNITCTGLDASKVGVKASFEDNTLLMSQFNELIADGCLFITAGGYYSATFKSWRAGEKDDGFYHCSNMWNSSNYNFLKIMSGYSVSVSHTTSNDYRPVRLIKQVND